MRLLDGKTVVITGAASGIGLGAVRAAVGQGAQVVAIDRDETPQVGQAATHVADVTDHSAVQGVVQSVIERFGTIDVLFANAGVWQGQPIDETPRDDVRRIFDINIMSVIDLVALVVPPMVAAKSGSIVFTASNGGIMGRPADPVYNASKHAVVGLMRSLAVGYAADGVRANAICPGAIDTPMLRSLAASDDHFRLRTAQFAATSPIPRIAQVEEVVDVFLFLASDMSSYVTGVALPVDGGKSAGVMRSHRYRTDFEPAPTPTRTGLAGPDVTPSASAPGTDPRD